ncbi:MAG: 23S rRNA (adenine(1618)-N(6))-methyltransferase RlmF [Flavobacteriaceae bacterium]|nr:23S rRNA (adenine(1618)-N(6))-methyltransferase RlmF [Flavobacteriaceae bacterium]
MSKNKPTKGLHPNNKHTDGYDFDKLTNHSDDLKKFVFVNQYGTQTIDFANPKAVKSLNTELLKMDYGIDSWDFSDENLCPPIPGRVDYIHHLNDLLNSSSLENDISILDIGTGATCIYPLLGNKTYNWKFVGTDIDTDSLKNSQNIIDSNNLSDLINLKLQPNSDTIFSEEIFDRKQFSASMCNPPFYASQYEAVEANARKLKGLGIETTKRNFGGSQNELWYKGGEKAFLHNYLYQSSLFKTNCFWYTSLVSKKENVESMIASLTKLKATEIKTIPMSQGNKVTRVVAWTFLTKEEQKNWL